MAALIRVSNDDDTCESAFIISSGKLDRTSILINRNKLALADVAQSSNIHEQPTLVRKGSKLV